MRTLALLLLMVVHAFTLWAEGTGEAQIYIFKPDSSMYQGVKVTSGTKSTVTDESGYASLQLAEGQQTVVLEVDGKKVTEFKIDVIAGEVAEAMLTLGEQKKALEIEVLSEEEEKAKVAAEDLEVGEKWGNIEGTILDSKSGEPIVEARVFVRGVNAEANTDTEGKFNVKLSVGSYSISIIHPEYATETIDGLVVEEDKVTSFTRELLPSAVELDAITVVDFKIKGGVAALVEEKKESKKLVEIIGAEQMSKSGDSDAAAALKRVTGITVVDGKFIYVRGMGERYSQTLLNGMSLPSPIVDKRVVPLDLFPADVIDSLVVQKTSSADKPGEYGGGIVQIRTKKIPEERIFSLSMSSTYNTESTFKDGLGHTFGGDRDFLGMDDGSRDVLGGVHGPQLRIGPTYNFTDAELSAMGRALSRTWTPTPSKLYPSGSFSLTYGDSFKINKDIPLGVFTTFGYSNKTTLRESNNTRFRYQNNAAVLQTVSKDSRTTNSIDLNGMVSVGTTLKEQHDISAMFMVIRTTEKRSARRDFELWVSQDTPKDATYYLEWNEQQLLNYQLSGEHRFLEDNLKIDWSYALSSVLSDRPGDREYTVNTGNFKEDSSQEDPMNISLREVVEDVDDFAINLSYDFEALENSFTFSAGYSKTDTERDVQTRLIHLQHERLTNVYPVEGILFDQNTTFTNPNDISATSATANIFAIDELDNPNAYSAERKVTALYAMLDATIEEDWVLNLGFRLEDTDTSFFFNNILDEKSISNNLPSFNLTYKGIENQQFRAGFGESVNRPALNELSEDQLQLEQGAPKVEGSRDLKTAVITNYDMKWEYFLSPSDSFAVGLFYKSIDKPIELFTGTQGDEDIVLTYTNADSATLSGIEIDFRRSLLFLKDAWKDYYFATNFTYSDGSVEGIDVESQPGNTTVAFVVDAKRDFVGQAPLVGNFSIGYDNPETGRNFNLLYNYVDERTYSSPRDGLPATILDTFHQMDFVYGQKVYKNIKAKLKIQNILDSDITILQNDNKVQTYKKGISFSLGLSASL